jgi:hypothetical protein
VAELMIGVTGAENLLTPDLEIALEIKEEENFQNIF